MISFGGAATRIVSMKTRNWRKFGFFGNCHIPGFPTFKEDTRFPQMGYFIEETSLFQASYSTPSCFLIYFFYLDLCVISLAAKLPPVLIQMISFGGAAVRIVSMKTWKWRKFGFFGNCHRPGYSHLKRKSDSRKWVVIELIQKF
ncbi:hypothetical protein CEXT_507121 [Caerostris extrusa]|uniref:Uncharacterized protein n=1 Tax=Caerostris extrusa TaxID=172846 RepID=A0AAV4UTB9_CAEEX|nr:hypothetical protein CEXT_507121 [Caerostris extrusa]